MKIEKVTDAQWLAMTVFMEAEGEPPVGKDAVAFVIYNRAQNERRSISDVVLEHWQFSAWNTDSPTRLKLDTAAGPAWDDACRAAEGVLNGTTLDPTHGATHYLNIEAVLKATGRYPTWFDPKRVTARIGRHTFLKL